MIGEMVVDGGGHFNPAGIDGVYTCLYCYRPTQHMAVPRVTQEYKIEYYNQRTY